LQVSDKTRHASCSVEVTSICEFFIVTFFLVVGKIDSFNDSPLQEAEILVTGSASSAYLINWSVVVTVSIIL
jgi:hypothetical protein